MKTAWLAAALLAGCASNPKDDPRTSAEAVEPLMCSSKPQCDTYWQRAQAWVAANSAYKIQTANDVLIQTYGPFGSKVDMAYLITRVPENSGGSRIWIKAGCDNFIRCAPTYTEAVISFKRFVKQQ